ncbi:MAG: class I SAM-dependent methyltransferase [Oscillospiraceae bacterium]|nr:class I SAM-dependent methyltransferase [Oscillospiraceae bacterium]
MDVRTHYDLLIDEENDPFRDPPQLRAYMDNWDGPAFLAALALEQCQEVLEIGIGTGRLAARVAPDCARLTGIDISPKTVARAADNLAAHANVDLICGDFLTHFFEKQFDAVYSSLTMMHFEDKAAFLSKAASLLRPGGKLVLSLDKNQSDTLDMGTRRLRIYPDTPEEIIPLLGPLRLASRLETEFAHILVCEKSL